MSYFSQSVRKTSIQPNLTAPSPFRYNPAKISKPAYAQTPFGSTAKLDRSITSKKNGLNGSAPFIEPYQQYQNVLNQLSNLVDKQQKTSFAFISKTERFTNEKQKTPGPGEYNMLLERKRTLSSQKLKKNIYKNISMSTSHIKVPSIPSDHLGYRQDQNNIMKKVVMNVKLEPHPGSYDIRTDLTQSKGLKWKQQLKKNKQTMLSPGPGSYNYKNVSELKAPISSFVSTSDRFNQNSKKLIKPGPGSYNVFPVHKKNHSYNQQGNFNSKTSRFGLTNDVKSNVGPGQYFNSIKQRVKAKSMGTLRKKINTNQENTQTIIHKKTIFDEKNQNPGPGQYANTQGLSFKLQKQLFRKFNETTLPKQKRNVFQLSQNIPGPGAYEQKKQIRQNERTKKQSKPTKKIGKKTEVVNLKDYQDQITPSPFDYGNFTNTIQQKVKHYENKMTLTQSKAFGTGELRFKHYEEDKLKNIEMYNTNPDQQQNEQVSSFLRNPAELGYYEKNKRVKKLVMTNLKVKIPFGSSTTKMKQEIISQSPGKFYSKQESWVKKSHNIRSKLN